MVKEGSEDVRPLPFHLDVLVEMQDGEYVAHCLQMDIVATGRSKDEAVSDLLDLIGAQIDFAVEHGNIENILRPAPREVWQKLLRVYYSAKMVHCLTTALPTAAGRPRMEAAVCYA